MPRARVDAAATQSHTHKRRYYACPALESPLLARRVVDAFAAVLAAAALASGAAVEARLVAMTAACAVDAQRLHSVGYSLITLLHLPRVRKHTRLGQRSGLAAGQLRSLTLR